MIKTLTNVYMQTKRMIKSKKVNIMIPEGAPSAEENTMGAGKYRFSLMKAPTPAEMEKSPKLAWKSY